MGRYITGKMTGTFYFSSLYVGDNEDEIDAIFPEGFDAELVDCSFTLKSEDEDEEDED